MKILAHSKMGMLQIGENIENYTWFYLDESISSLFNLPDGTEIEIVTENRNGKKYILSISTKNMIGEFMVLTPQPKISREDLIVRQSVLKAIGASIPALTGQVDPNNIWDIMIVGYEKLLEKVTK